jgi:hypothetical protein
VAYVPRSSNGSTFVVTENCTLVLPSPDYAALLAAALRGPAWLSGATSTAPVMEGVTAMQLAQGANVSVESTSFVFGTFAAWG